MCYVDIDRQSVTIPEDLPEFPNQIPFLREIQEAFRQFNVPIEWSTPESENNDLRHTPTACPRLHNNNNHNNNNNNNDGDDYHRSSPHHHLPHQQQQQHQQQHENS